jgi:hypothetical protein
MPVLIGALVTLTGKDLEKEITDFEIEKKLVRYSVNMKHTRESTRSRSIRRGHFYVLILKCGA